MPTTAQILANRNNSQKSTGPKTAEGKAVVSQNAVKHGLFAAEAVITGENPADYEAYHDQFLAELAPVGMVESMFAARIVSLAWRLQRAERMQNQSIEDMIERTVTNPKARDKWEYHCYEQGFRRGDPRIASDHLPLGRIATHDWSNFKVLDRMLLYERRIENSLNKTIHKLKTQQMIRIIEQADARKQEADRAISSLMDEAATRQAVKNDDLKKQSQFEQAQYDAMSFMQGGYGNNPASRAEENKANSKPITRVRIG
jgi:hypothetical protein